VTTSLPLGRGRQIGLGGMRGLAGVAACLWPVLWVVNPGGLVHQKIVIDQFTSLELGLSLCFVFLSNARPDGRIPTALAIALAAASAAISIWLFGVFAGDGTATYSASLGLTSACLLAMALCLYACWRTSGIETVLMIGAFLVFGYVAQFLPSWIGSPPIRITSYVSYMVFGSNGLLGQALQIISTSVVVFLLFGAAFELSGGTRAIGAIALLVARLGRGAAISVCIIASGLFGMISGSATSNVLAAGSFSIPGMKRMGVAPATAGGIEAAASTIGQVMPPVMGAAAFLMASNTGIPYAQVALASLAPAVLCYAALFLQGEALGRRLERDHGPAAIAVEHLSLGWDDLLHLVPVAGLVLSLLWAPTAPELSGVVATTLAMLVAVLRKGRRVTWRELQALVPKTSKSVTGLVITASTVGLILAVISSTGLDVQLTILISTLGAHSLLLSLILASLTAFVLGLGVGTSGVYIVTGTLLAPGLVQLGVPLIAAHLFVLYSAMLSMITPPVAFASLTAAGLAGAGFYETSNEAMRFGWALFAIPFLIVYSPALVLVGDPWTIASAMVSASSGLLLMTQAATTGWRSRSVLVWFAFALGVCLLLPIFPPIWRLAIALLGIGWTGLRVLRERRLAVAI
jgi:TRAP transporter 4TM/12TM fusion protein